MFSYIGTGAIISLGLTVVLTQISGIGDGYFLYLYKYVGSTYGVAPRILKALGWGCIGEYIKSNAAVIKIPRIYEMNMHF